MPLRVNMLKIEEARKRRGWRKGELAKRSGISATRLSQIYKEAKAGNFPTSHRLKEIVEALGLNMEDVVIEEESQQIAC